MPLYDAVRTPQPRKRDPRLLACIAIALTLVLLAFFPILWAAHLQRQYRHFISGLGESVLYAKAQGSLYVRQNGRQFRARGPASRLYLEVNAAGMGKRQSSAPDSAPDAELEFGDGCILRFWGLDVWDGYNRQWVPGVFVWYRGANGKSICMTPTGCNGKRWCGACPKNRRNDMGLYDAVRREEKPRRRWHPMWVVALAFAAALVTALGLTISKPQRDHDRFIRCMSDISSSTTYAFSGKFTSLRARVDGQDLRITQENGYALYGKLFNMNATFSRDVPKEDSLRLDYGDGAVLELWPYHLPDSSDRSEGIFVRFVNPEGKTYTYYTDRDAFARVTQCLSPENNPAWAE